MNRLVNDKRSQIARVHALLWTNFLDCWEGRLVRRGLAALSPDRARIVLGRR